MADLMLSANQATKSYGDLIALTPVDIEIPRGQLVALVGHNGSGKSTFLRLVAGTLDLSGGSIEIDGAPVGSSPARAAVSFVPDDPVLYDDLSVREHLSYVAALHGVDASADDVDAIIERFGLLHRADDLPARFSRGLRQKTSLALGVVRPFELLLVDEPFVGLDASGKAALMELLTEAHGAGRTLLVATHELSYLETVSRCVALRDGELIYDGASKGLDVLSRVS